jgi:hypothetical protein
MKILKISGVVAGLLAVAACGGGGGSTGSDSNNVLSGVALDGYLHKANVCLDLNDNNLCDPGEPASTADELGRYTLANVTPAQVSAHSVLVNAIAGVTIDQVQPGVPVTASYLLTAPAGSSTISPLTTLVKAEMIVNGVDAGTATANTFNRLFANATSAGVKTFTVQERYPIRQPDFVSQAPAPTEYWELSGLGWSPVDSAVTDRFPSWSLTGGEYGTAGAMLPVSRIELGGESLDQNCASSPAPTRSRWLTTRAGSGPFSRSHAMARFVKGSSRPVRWWSGRLPTSTVRPSTLCCSSCRFASRATPMRASSARTERADSPG